MLQVFSKGPFGSPLLPFGLITKEVSPFDLLCVSSHLSPQTVLISSLPKNLYLDPGIFLLQVCHNAAAAQSCGPGTQTVLQVGGGLGTPS